MAESQQRFLLIMLCCPQPCVHLIKSHYFKYIRVDLYQIWSITAAKAFFLQFSLQQNVRIHAPSIAAVRGILGCYNVDMMKVLQICL